MEAHAQDLAPAPMPAPKEGGASRAEAAEFLGVSLSTIKRELHDRVLPSKKIRGRVVIPWAALRARLAVADPVKTYEAKKETPDGE